MEDGKIGVQSTERKVRLTYLSGIREDTFNLLCLSCLQCLPQGHQSNHTSIYRARPSPSSFWYMIPYYFVQICGAMRCNYRKLQHRGDLAALLKL